LAKLVIENGPGKGREVRLIRGATVTCGRDSGVELPLPDSLASRKHFTIESRDGEFHIIDQGSSNGTFVNGHNITEKVLKLGDSIQVGETIISVLEDAERTDTGGLLGQVIAGYRLEKRVGRGGMGTVYRANQLSLDRPVALKILSDDLASNREFTSMFVHEARAAARLSHPNIVLAYDVGKDKEKFFFAMEYVAGGSVQEMLAKVKKVPLKQAVHFVIEAAKALEYAEKQGVVHRDIKPDNLMITKDGGIKICDLGLAKSVTSGEPVTAQEGICGSPHYIAPEQAQGKAVDHRADIYSLGATFYRMLTGITPFTGNSVKDLIKKHITEKPRPIREMEPSAPESVARVIERMMAKDPAKRYQSASEVINDLTSLQAFDYAIDLEPEPEVPLLNLAEEVPAAETRQDKEVPLQLEEEPIRLEEAPQRVAVIPPVEAPSLPPAPFPWRKARKCAAILLGLVLIGGCAALIMWAIPQLWPKEEPWVSELYDVWALRNKDPEGAVEKARGVLKKYPDKPDAQSKAHKTLEDLKAYLLDQAQREGSRAKYGLLTELFPEDEKLAGTVKERLEELDRLAALRDAENDLSALWDDAVAFERQNNANLVEKAAEMQSRFKAVVDRKAQAYAQISSKRIDDIVARAQKGVDDYKPIIEEIKKKPEFDATVEALKASMLNKQYATARTQLETLQKNYPFLIPQLGLFIDADGIERSADLEYRIEVRPKVTGRLRESKYDSASKMYDNFQEVFAILDEYKTRYGDTGPLIDEMKALTDQMRQLQQIRSDAQDLVAQKKYAEAGDLLKQKLPTITHEDLSDLVKKALKELQSAQLTTEGQQKIEAFDELKKQAQGLLDTLEVEKAQQAFDKFKEDGNVIPETKADYEALGEEIAAERDFLQAVVLAVSNALKAGKSIVPPGYGKAVTSLDMESVKMGSTAAPWSELAGKADDLSMLFEYAAGSLKTDSERLGGAMLCLKYGRSLRVFRMGYDAMTALERTDPARYSDMLDKYVLQLLEKLTALMEELKKVYFNPETPKERVEQLGKEILAIRDFQQELASVPKKPQE
jgi:serine/threonine-protein kinase